MAAVNDVPLLVDKKEVVMLLLGGNGTLLLKMMVVVQDERLKSIIMSCLPDDIIESVISCVSAKETWTDLVHSFEGQSPLKVSHRPTPAIRPCSMRLSNDGVNLSKHEINVVFVNNLPEKWLTFSQGLRNANHTQTLNLSDIYERFVYEDNLIQRRYSDTKKVLITTPSSTAISTAFFSNNVIQDFQENYDDEVDERSSDEYLRDLDIEYQERALLANSKRFIKIKKFSGQKANENTECYKCGNKGHFARDCFSKTSQADPKFHKDYKSEYKKMKAKLALLEASPSSSQNPKTFQPKNKGLVTETFDWNEEEVSDDEEVTQVKVLMALADDELTVGKSYARNGEWVDITIRKVNTLLSMDEDADWQNYLKYINIDLKFVEEQRLNLLSKYNKMVFELNKCRDELLILKQAKLDAGGFTMISGDYTLTFQPHFPRERPSLGIVGIKSLLEVTTAKLTGNQQVVSELVALRNFAKKKLLLHSCSACYKEMDQDSAHMVAASKVSMLKPVEYEL
ncbi:retrovirus-related pol polyprotein from transposon TNT 1-94 [Tanacetum coccineum]